MHSLAWPGSSFGLAGRVLNLLSPMLATTKTPCTSRFGRWHGHVDNPVQVPCVGKGDAM